MKMWREEDHPRDSKGKFAERQHTECIAKRQLERAGYNTTGMTDEWATKLVQEIGLNKVSLSLYFFSEKGVEKESSASLKRRIRSLELRIKEHEMKIAHPEYLKGWDNVPPKARAGIEKAWKREIEAFKLGIKNRKEELKKRGEAID